MFNSEKIQPEFRVYRVFFIPQEILNGDRSISEIRVFDWFIFCGIKKTR
jgi:hypothetical protein